ncbi:MAG: Gfo/Idh/MocA family oxidoreductase [Treponema sp.]|jgi:predicted dehydrogenase|nr:Gfo/Idh/MocA family oxidoreductase [Treponema sp.]
MKKNVYTAAVIGCGRIGFSLGFDRRREQPASHTMALKKNHRIRLIAGCDTDMNRLAHWHQFVPSAAVFRSVDELLSACRPDIFVIAVNEAAHFEVARKVISTHPRLVILEKPVALTMKEGNIIRKDSISSSVPVMVNHERRFAQDYDSARRYLPCIGALQSITAVLGSGMPVYDPARESSGAYSLLHDGTHLADCVLSFLGSKQPLRDPVITGLYRDEENSAVIRNISAHYITARCPEVTLRIDGRSRYFRFEIDVTGTDGRIRIGNGIAEFYRRAESTLYTGFYSLSRNGKIKIPAATRSFTRMVENAVDFLDGCVPLLSTLDDGLAALFMMEEIATMLRR